MYLDQQGDGSTINCLVNCLVNRTKTETECSYFVINIYSEAGRKWQLLLHFHFLRCLDEEQANLKHISGCQYPTGHAGVSFEDRNTYH